MRTCRFLYQEVISDENIECAIKEACVKRNQKNRRKREKLIALSENPNRINIVRGWIVNYETRKTPPKEIFDGIRQKKRNIYVPTMKETVIEHAVVRVLDKHLGRGTYDHTYAAIKGRGAHKARHHIIKWIKTRKVKYYLKMDIKQYFPSVSQPVLMAMLEKQIKDHRMIELIRKIVSATDTGIPLGFYISQWIANYYLRRLDHHIKQDLKCDVYIRWMDDMVVFGSNKRKLHRIREGISVALEDIGLELKDNWRVERFAYGEQPGVKRCRGCFLDFMGFRFYRNRVTLRESIFYRITRKARRIWLKDKPTIHELKQMTSYLGWLSWTDTYGAYLEYIKPLINVQYIKRRISAHDRKENKNVKSRVQGSERLPGTAGGGCDIIQGACVFA